MKDTIKVEPSTDDRTPEQAARAAPVSLPAGSYDSAELQKAFDNAAKAKSVETRDQVVTEAIDKLNEIGTDAGSLDLHDGQKRVTVVDEALGVTENRVVFDAAAAEEAPAASAPNNPAEGSASPASKGE